MSCRSGKFGKYKGFNRLGDEILQDLSLGILANKTFQKNIDCYFKYMIFFKGTVKDCIEGLDTDIPILSINYSFRYNIGTILYNIGLIII